MISHSPKIKALSLFSIFFTFFIDNLCWAIAFPIFAPYFLDPHNVLFSPSVSESTRSVILGFFLMAFSLGQFVGSPIMGDYSDRHGRKKALIGAVFFTLIGLALTAWSMGKNMLILLFVGRLLTGIFASSTSICLAAVTDLSRDEKTRVRNFGYFAATAGLSFIIGAFVGGKLADPTIDAFFDPSLPIWLAGGLTFLNLLFVIFAFHETTKVDTKATFDFFQAFRNIKVALRTKKIQKMYAIYFLFLFSWTILFQFIPVIGVRRFDFTSSNIGDLALFMGICWMIGSVSLNQFLTIHFTSIRILEVCLVSFTFLTALVAFPDPIYTVISIVGLCVAIGGIAWPLCNSFISSLAPKNMQGKVLGMNQSVQSLAMTLAPAIGGVAFKVSMFVPFLIGSGASLLATILYYTLKEK